VPLAIGKERVAAICDRSLQTDGSHRILQGAARPHMHVHVSAGDERKPGFFRERSKLIQPCAIVASMQKLDRDPCAAREDLGQPARRFFVRFGFGNEERETMRNAACEIFPRQLVASFRCLASSMSDQLAKIAVAFAIRREQYQTRPVLKRKFGSDDEFELKCFCCFVRPHYAGDRTVIGQSERVISELVCAFDELLRMRGATQKREVGKAVEFGVAHGLNSKIRRALSRIQMLFSCVKVASDLQVHPEFRRGFQYAAE
jgi:hypothetical protein